MTLVNRTAVEGTGNPMIHIGHKAYRKKDGTLTRTRTYYAEYSLNGKQQRPKLNTRNKATAINAAHKLHDQLCRGEPIEAPKSYTVDEAVTLYLDTCKARSLAPKTIQKYELTLGNLRAFCAEEHVRLTQLADDLLRRMPDPCHEIPPSQMRPMPCILA